MAKEEHIEMEGTVTEALPNTMWTRGDGTYFRKNAQALHPYFTWRQGYR